MKAAHSHHPRRVRQTQPRSWSWGISLIGVVVVLATLAGLVGLFGQQLFELKEDQTVLFLAQTEAARTTQLSVGFFFPADRRAYLVYLPADLSVQVLGGYGTYQLGAIQPLLEIEKKTAVFTRATFAMALRRLLSQVVTDAAGKIVTTKVHWQYQLLQSALKPGAGTATWFQKLQWYFMLTELEGGEVEITRVENLDQWQKFIKSLPQSNQHQGCPVAVVNATHTQGLARQWADVLELSQVTIVRVTDTAQPQEKTRLLIADSQQCQSTTQALIRALPESIQPEVDETITNSYRAKMVIMLGEDVASLVK